MKAMLVFEDCFTDVSGLLHSMGLANEFTSGISMFTPQELSFTDLSLSDFERLKFNDFVPGKSKPLSFVFIGRDLLSFGEVRFKLSFSFLGSGDLQELLAALLPTLSPVLMPTLRPPLSPTL